MRRGAFLNKRSFDKRNSMLTSRQKEVLDGMTRGLSYRKIAREMGCGPNCAYDYARAIFRKCGVENREQLMAIL